MKRKINFLTKKNKIKKNILLDIVNFQKIHYNNEISILPDIHQKKGEMSPTGCVLVSDLITPSFTHLCVGSGISLWKVDVNKNFDVKKFDSLFSFLQKKIPGSNSKNLKIHNFSKMDLINNFKDGANSLVKQKILKKKYLKNIENNGNFLSNIKNPLSFEEAVPDYLKKICYENFGTLGTGNTFIELHEIKESFKKQNKNKKSFYIYIHSGISDAYLTMFFSPRWGLHGKKFIPFEKEKWNFFAKHLVDKNSIEFKKNYFPNSSKFFGIDKNSHDGKLYLSSMSYLCNMSICNRVYIGTIIEKYINKKFHIDSISLEWDTIHDSIKEEKINNKNKIVHRHGASPVYNDSYIKKNLKNNINYKKIIIPSSPGGDSLIASAKNNVYKFNNSICHGTGRILDRPEARLKYNHNATIEKINKKVKKIYYRMKDISGENPDSFRSIYEIINILEKKKLIKKEFITKPIYILKS